MRIEGHGERGDAELPGALRHPFEDGALASVTLPLAEPNDAGVAAATLLLSGSNFGKEDFYGVFLVQPGSGVEAMQPATPASWASEPFGWRAKVVTAPAVADAT